MNDHQLIFKRIKQSNAYAARASRQLPSAAGDYFGAGCLIAFMAIWCLGALAMTAVFFFVGLAADPSIGICMGMIPGLMLVMGIAMVVMFFRRAAQYSQAPVQAEAALVVSKHSRGGTESSRHYITLEFEDGQRREFRIIHDREAALIGIGDHGVAFTRLDVFLTLDRVPM